MIVRNARAKVGHRQTPTQKSPSIANILGLFYWEWLDSPDRLVQEELNAKQMRYFFFLLLILCSSVWADIFIREDINTDPVPDNFTICHGNGCIRLDFMRLTSQQWLQIKNQFLPSPLDAQEERERIRRAIALMEKIVGEATGTWRDKGGTFNYGEGQMDCIDESTNTSLYMKMFEKFGLMRFHQVADRETRGWFLSGWPHTSAVIRENSSDHSESKSGLWAVDSWFLDNGEPPYILPLEIWKSGWEPIR